MRSNNKKAGMGLLGLLVAVGIGSVVSLAVLNMIQQTHEQEKRAVLKSELIHLKNRIAEMLRQDRTFLNTLGSTANVNMACLRDRTACAAPYVATAYAPTQDRIVLFDGSPAPGQAFYDSRASSAQGFTLKGATCNGFSATGGGNDNCPVGFIMTWYVNQPSSTEGLALTISAKMVFNPSDLHPLKRYFNATNSVTTLGAYDIAVTKTVESLTDLNVVACTVGSVQINHMGSNIFYQAASVPTGSRCNSEARVCTVVNNVAALSGSYTHPSCVQNCSGAWGACSVSCGGGTQTFTHQIPANQWGAACAFADGAVRSCNTSPCPVNCVGSWGTCSGGSRTYTITTPASGGGAACPFANGATQSCGTNCVGAWGTCSGGMRTYTVTTPASGGGATCPVANGTTQSCGVNCVGSWGACSAGSRTYTVTTPASGGGSACPYSNGQTQSCGTNCVGSWSTCSGGSQSYSVSTPASGGGAACPYTNGAVRSCGTNCVGSWGSCSSSSQTYTITTPASGGGVSCPYANGQTQSCGGGTCTHLVACTGMAHVTPEETCMTGQSYVGQCPYLMYQDGPIRGGSGPESGIQYWDCYECGPGSTAGVCTNNPACSSGSVDCVGSWSSCNGSGIKTYTITTPASGGGAACPYANGEQSCSGCTNGSRQCCGSTWSSAPPGSGYNFCGCGNAPEWWPAHLPSGC